MGGPATPPTTTSRRAGERPLGHRRHARAWAASLIGAGLLLFTWPFVRTPTLDIGRSYAHLLVAWAIFVVGLFVLARSLGRRPAAGGGGDA